MTVPYSPLAIANEFIGNFAGSNGIEHMKLQKLVYCAHGWWLATHEPSEPNLVNESPQVWKHGPVFDSLYRVLRVFGRAPITEPQSSTPFDEPTRVDNDDESANQLIRWTWNRYGHLSSFALSDLTHKQGTPWSRIAKEHNYRVPQHMEIPDEYIREEFIDILTNGRSIPGALRADNGNRKRTSA